MWWVWESLVSAIFERVWGKKEKEFTVNIISSQCIKCGLSPEGREAAPLSSSSGSQPSASSWPLDSCCGPCWGQGTGNLVPPWIWSMEQKERVVKQTSELCSLIINDKSKIYSSFQVFLAFVQIWSQTLNMRSKDKMCQPATSTQLKRITELFG